MEHNILSIYERCVAIAFRDDVNLHCYPGVDRIIETDNFVEINTPYELSILIEGWMGDVMIEIDWRSLDKYFEQSMFLKRHRLIPNVVFVQRMYNHNVMDGPAYWTYTLKKK